jgi:phenylacetate-coenzyme A ligase PaaK-like adenylate-forming protein
MSAQTDVLTDQAEELDELVRRMMRWHFSAETGSRFWTRAADDLSFDPLRDVHSFTDLRRFPDLTDHWRDIPVRDLVPRGLLDGQHRLRPFESGGTTGGPKRIVESTFCQETFPWLDKVLDSHGVPRTGDWLLLGPTGPHIVGYSIGELAWHRQALCHYIDLDSRWVKRCVRDSDFPSVGRYVEHVVDQAVDVLRGQDVRVLVSTPPVLEAICRRADARELVADRVQAIIWAGTSASLESLRLLEEEIFPDAKLIGLYGNTMGGVSPQRPRRADDEQPCVFQPFQPNCQIELVDPDDENRLVEYGERGRVRGTVLCTDYFMPNVMERDTAIRVRPTPEFPWDGVADVRPLEDPSGPVIIEGVY